MPKFVVKSELSRDEIRSRIRDTTGSDPVSINENSHGRVIDVTSEQASKINKLPINARHAQFGGRIVEQLNG